MDVDARNPRHSVPAADLSEAAVSARIEALRRLGLHQALPRLLLELDGILRARLDAGQRLALMQCLKKPVLKAAAGLPKPPGRRRGVAERVPLGMTLEQRLLLLMTRNLRQTLYELDRARNRLLDGNDGARDWVLLQCFRFIGRQLRYGIDWDRPWPKHTWQELHDLFVYLVVRGSEQLNADLGVAACDDALDVELEYKRLLLLGLADRLTDRRSRTGDFFHLLKAWAGESRLQEPERALGEKGLVKVDVTRDEPPRLCEAPLIESFRGWVLRPALGFADYIEYFDGDSGRALRFNAFRAAPCSRI